MVDKIREIPAFNGSKNSSKLEDKFGNICSLIGNVSLPGLATGHHTTISTNTTIWTRIGALTIWAIVTVCPGPAMVENTNTVSNMVHFCLKVLDAIVQGKSKLTFDGVQLGFL